MQSNFRGVYHRPGAKPWRAVLTIGSRRQVYVGVFQSEVCAAVARDRAAIAAGVKCKLNFPELVDVL
jgi:hypothetical protein